MVSEGNEKRGKYLKLTFIVSEFLQPFAFFTLTKYLPIVSAIKYDKFELSCQIYSIKS